ncbi:MAG: DUF485 domain-containing protein [Acetobacteraceae bacterium]|nr:DUF485 domain-containing protein [Acetobacteraceae bacterium]
MDDQMAARIRANPRFIELERKRKRFAWTLTIIMLVIYYGFLALVAFAPNWMGASFIGSVTIGFPVGIAVILSAIILTGIYVVRANGEFDRMSHQIVEYQNMEFRPKRGGYR